MTGRPGGLASLRAGGPGRPGARAPGQPSSAPQLSADAERTTKARPTLIGERIRRQPPGVIAVAGVTPDRRVSRTGSSRLKIPSSADFLEITGGRLSDFEAAGPSNFIQTRPIPCRTDVESGRFASFSETLSRERFVLAPDPALGRRCRPATPITLRSLTRLRLAARSNRIGGARAGCVTGMQCS